jgi:hypothetical protein
MRAFSLLTALWALLCLSGCTGYHLGASKPTRLREIQTLSIPNFQNATLEPRIESMLTNALIHQLQQDATYRITSEQDSDAILEGTLQQLNRSALRGSGRDFFNTAEFGIELVAQIKVTRRTTGEILLSRTFRGNSSFQLSRTNRQVAYQNDLRTADVNADERPALPRAAVDLAVQITSALSEGW